MSDKPKIKSRSDALLSHQVSATLLVQHGSIDLGMLDRGIYAEPEAAEFAARVRVVHDSELESQYPAQWPHRITVRLRDGRTLEGLSPNPPGGLGDRIATPVVEAKFAANSGAAFGANVQKVIAQVRGLEREPAMRRAASLLSGSSPSVRDVIKLQSAAAAGGA